MDAVYAVENEAMKLSAKQRAELVVRLQESLEEDVYLEEQIAEATDRLEAYKNGQIQSVDGRLFLAELKKRVQGA